jgi:vacuolar-type H+-ATPase subunit H
MAQQLADQLTGDAKAEVGEMLGEARTKSEQLLSDARAKADGMVSEARSRAETMLNDACTTAETLDRQSREKATSRKHDAARKHADIMGSISQEKSVLDKQVDELRAFEREYRKHLMIHLEAQLLALDQRAPAEPAETTRTPQRVVAAVLGNRADISSHVSEPAAGSDVAVLPA